jgi:hypothetical protein
MAVHLKFAQSWTRAVAQANAGRAAGAAAGAPTHTNGNRGGAPSLTPGASVTPASTAVAPRTETPDLPTRFIPMEQIPGMARLERLPVWAWWAGASCGLAVVIALVCGFLFGTGYRPVNSPSPAASQSNAAAPPAPAPIVPTEPVKLFDFEKGSVMGWKTKDAARFIQVMQVPAKGGTKALQVRLFHCNMTNQGYAQVQPPPNLARGSKIIARVLVPYGSATGLQAKAFVQDANWGWTDGGQTTVTPGVWTEIAVTVPQSAQPPLMMMGVHFDANADWTGRVFIDDVRISP